MRIGILHPGAMGADVGCVLTEGHSVLWLGVGRSAKTRARAIEAGLVEVNTWLDLVSQSDVIISLCPPHSAFQVAQNVATVRREGFLYVDANTISPETVRQISELFEPNTVVDATLTGAPGADNLTVWASGVRKSEACELFRGTRIATREIGDAVGQASAFKMCSGLRSKVIPALWATLIDAAANAGPEVEHAVRTHLNDIGYDLDHEAMRVAERAPKAWRWIGEMEESAKTLRELGLPSGFSEAAAATYARIAEAASRDGQD